MNKSPSTSSNMTHLENGRGLVLTVPDYLRTLPAVRPLAPNEVANLIENVSSTRPRNVEVLGKARVVYITRSRPLPENYLDIANSA